MRMERYFVSVAIRESQPGHFSRNHSCVPNSDRSFIGDTMVARANRGIEWGEEICMSYCNSDDPCPERKQHLSSYGFGAVLCDRLMMRQIEGWIRQMMTGYIRDKTCRAGRQSTSKRSSHSRTLGSSPSTKRGSAIAN